MAIHLTLAIVVRASGMLLLLLLGLATIALARRRADPIVFGTFFAGAGGSVVASNLAIAGGGAIAVWAADAFGVVAMLGAIAFYGREIFATSGRSRIVVTALALANLAIAGLAEWTFDPGTTSIFGVLPPDLAPAYQTYFRLVFPVMGAFAIVPGVLAVRALYAEEREVRVFAGLAAGTGVAFGFAVGGDALSGPGGATIFLVVAMPVLFAIVASAFAWAFVMVRRESRVARAVALAILGATLLGVLRVATTGIGLFFDPLGTVGLARLAGWVVLAITVVSAGWLDIKFLSRHRTGLAAAALALLFIVAQVAQSFFSAEFGLLTGGIVAGAFLFAASPIQRAMEAFRDREPRASAPSSPREVALASGANEDVYADAVRFALRDAVISLAEDRHLTKLAHRLGIHPERAIELREKCEREKGAR